MTWETSNRKERLPRNWNALRMRVLRRDGFKCQECGSRASEVDHIRPGDDHSLSNLQSLCSDCHSKKSSQEGVNQRRRNRELRKRPEENHPGLRKTVN